MSLYKSIKSKVAKTTEIIPKSNVKKRNEAVTMRSQLSLETMEKLLKDARYEIRPKNQRRRHSTKTGPTSKSANNERFREPEPFDTSERFAALKDVPQRILEKVAAKAKRSFFNSIRKPEVKKEMICTSTNKKYRDVKAQISTWRPQPILNNLYDPYPHHYDVEAVWNSDVWLQCTGQTREVELSTYPEFDINAPDEKHTEQLLEDSVCEAYVYDDKHAKQLKDYVCECEANEYDNPAQQLDTSVCEEYKYEKPTQQLKNSLGEAYKYENRARQLDNSLCEAYKHEKPTQQSEDSVCEAYTHEKPTQQLKNSLGEAYKYENRARQLDNSLCEAYKHEKPTQQSEDSLCEAYKHEKPTQQSEDSVCEAYKYETHAEQLEDSVCETYKYEKHAEQLEDSVCETYKYEKHAEQLEDSVCEAYEYEKHTRQLENSLCEAYKYKKHARQLEKSLCEAFGCKKKQTEVNAKKGNSDKDVVTIEDKKVINSLKQPVSLLTSSQPTSEAEIQPLTNAISIKGISGLSDLKPHKNASIPNRREFTPASTSKRWSDLSMYKQLGSKLQGEQVEDNGLRQCLIVKDLHITEMTHSRSKPTSEGAKQPIKSGHVVHNTGFQKRDKRLSRKTHCPMNNLSDVFGGWQSDIDDYPMRLMCNDQSFYSDAGNSDSLFINVASYNSFHDLIETPLCSPYSTAPAPAEPLINAQMCSYVQERHIMPSIQYRRGEQVDEDNDSSVYTARSSFLPDINENDSRGWVARKLLVEESLVNNFIENEKGVNMNDLTENAEGGDCGGEAFRAKGLECDFEHRINKGDSDNATDKQRAQNRTHVEEYQHCNFDGTNTDIESVNDGHRNKEHKDTANASHGRWSPEDGKNHIKESYQDSCKGRFAFEEEAEFTDSQLDLDLRGEGDGIRLAISGEGTRRGKGMATLPAGDAALMDTAIIGMVMSEQQNSSSDVPLEKATRNDIKKRSTASVRRSPIGIPRHGLRDELEKALWDANTISNNNNTKYEGDERNPRTNEELLQTTSRCITYSTPEPGISPSLTDMSLCDSPNDQDRSLGFINGGNNPEIITTCSDSELSWDSKTAHTVDYDTRPSMARGVDDEDNSENETRPHPLTLTYKSEKVVLPYPDQTDETNITLTPSYPCAVDLYSEVTQRSDEGVAASSGDSPTAKLDYVINPLTFDCLECIVPPPFPRREQIIYPPVKVKTEAKVARSKSKMCYLTKPKPKRSTRIRYSSHPRKRSPFITRNIQSASATKFKSQYDGRNTLRLPEINTHARNTDKGDQTASVPWSKSSTRLPKIYKSYCLQGNTTTTLTPQMDAAWLIGTSCDLKEHRDDDHREPFPCPSPTFSDKLELEREWLSEKK